MIYPTIASNGVGIILPYAESDVDTESEMRQNGCLLSTSSHNVGGTWNYGAYGLAPIGGFIAFVYINKQSYYAVSAYGTCSKYYQMFLGGNQSFYHANEEGAFEYRYFLNADDATASGRINGIAVANSDAEAKALLDAVAIQTVNIPVQLNRSGGGIVRHLPNYCHADLIGSHLPVKEVA